MPRETRQVRIALTIGFLVACGGGCSGSSHAGGGAGGGTALGAGGGAGAGTGGGAGSQGIGGTGSGGALGTGGAVGTGGASGTGGTLGSGGTSGANGDAGRDIGANMDTSSDGGAAPAAANTFRCGNWADQRDNFVNGDLQLSGTTTADSYATVLAKATAILTAFQNTVGANSVRVPINEPTVMDPWWNAYKGTIDAAIARGMKVIVAYWAWHNGRMDDVNAFYAMWDVVVNAYAGNNLVYFQIFNEPYAYQPADFITLAVQWLARYPSLPRGRVIVAGNYTDQDVRPQGADARLNGTLLSLHIYPFSNATQTSTQAWRDMLQTNLGAYASRTVVSEWGAPMTTGADYSGAGDGDHNASFITALSTYLHDNGIGSCYWPVLRTADPWSLTTLSGTGTNLSLTVTNASGLNRVKAAFGLQ